MIFQFLYYLKIFNSLSANFLFHYATILMLKKTTAYHPHTNGQVKHYNRTLVQWLWLYIADNQQNRTVIFQPMTYAYNCEQDRFTNVSAVFVKLTRYPSVPVTLNSPTAVPTSGLAAIRPRAVTVQLLIQLPKMPPKVSRKLHMNQHRCKNHLPKESNVAKILYSIIGIPGPPTTKRVTYW